MFKTVPNNKFRKNSKKKKLLQQMKYCIDNLVM